MPVDEMTRLYGELVRPLIGYAMSFTGEIHSAEDIVSETFVRAAEHCLVNDELPVRAWFYKVARNLALDMLRRKGRLSQDEIPEMTDDSLQANPEAVVLSRERARELTERIMELPELYRSALLLREIDGLSYAEIAGVMGVSLDNVKVLLYRAKQKVRDAYGKENNYGGAG